MKYNGLNEAMALYRNNDLVKGHKRNVALCEYIINELEAQRDKYFAENMDLHSEIFMLKSALAQLTGADKFKANQNVEYRGV